MVRELRVLLNRVAGSTWENNTATSRGGGLYNSGELIVNGGSIVYTVGADVGSASSFSGNTATDGGAVYTLIEKTAVSGKCVCGE